MKANELHKLGVPLGQPMVKALELIRTLAVSGSGYEALKEEIITIVSDPANFLDDDIRGEFASILESGHFRPRSEPAPYKSWCIDPEPDSIRQIENSCQLPVSVAAALMPDAHVGYGLPIGGVLATENAIIPYAVGVDIACRMKLSVLDVPLTELNDERGRGRLKQAIERETRFGIRAKFKNKREHGVMDLDWDVRSITNTTKTKHGDNSELVVVETTLLNLSEIHDNSLGLELRDLSGITKP